jgi:3,4-dihydroxy 2-butanone 4-phosphate synthase / GTP cyclohydrolase II
VRLLTNNPDKVTALQRYGLVVSGRVSLPVATTPENLHYLRTKRDRMGHHLAGLPEAHPVIQARPLPEAPERTTR